MRLLTPALLLCCFSAAAQQRPNLLVILTDDQGWGDLSLHGNKNLSSPHIDSLAKGGASFARFYVCPVCSPTRAEFLTGRWHPRTGVRAVTTGGERLDLDEATIADAFKAAGYATACFGKWHNGTQYPYHPLGRGFEQYYGFTSGHWGTYFDPPLDHNGEPARGKGYLPDDLTDRAMAYMADNAAQKRPFFCYVAYNTPHSPMQVPDRFYHKFATADLPMRASNPRQEDLDHTRAALAMVENLDHNIGRLLAKLDQLNIARDTIIVYFHDNGPNGARWNDNMRGRKGSTDEGGVRSPLLIRYPGRVLAGHRVEPVAAAIDLLPTLADLAGIDLKPAKPLDGISLKPLLSRGGLHAWPERTLFSHWNGRVSARTNRWRLDQAGRLYDMDNDPAQQTDVTAKHPEVAARLKDAVEKWKADVLAQVRGKDLRPYPVGHRNMPLTQLPARDGIPHGNIKRSAQAPNCSFFENWTAREDKITWNVEVLTPGRYELTLHYTCPTTDVGSTVQAALHGATLESRVTEPHDPPLTGREHDRTPRRGESFVKDFKPLTVGTMRLPAGKGELSLRALNIPGKTVLDLRAVTLRLLE